MKNWIFNQRYFLMLWLCILAQQILFYQFNHMGLSFVFATMALMTAFLFLASVHSKGRWFLLVIMSLNGVIMLIQSLHYIHFSKFASFHDLTKLSYAGPVMDVAVGSFSLKYGLFFLPFVFLLIFFSRFRYEKKKQTNSIYGAVSLMALYLVVISLHYPASKTEVFAYHADDFYRTYLHQVDEKDLDLDLGAMYSAENKQDKKYFGLAKDKNLINIQVESLSAFVINLVYEGQEITPNLNRLIRENSFYLDHYYQMIGSGHTSDAEFVINNSLYPIIDGPTYQNYAGKTFYGLPWVLKDHHYGRYVFHGYDKNFWNRSKAYPGQGFEKFYDDTAFQVTNPIGFGLRDKDFFDQSIPYLKELKEPFYAFMITLTSHVPFEMPKEEQKITLRKEHENTVLGHYLQAIHYTDAAIGELILGLKKEGLYENSLITIYGDHYAIDGTDEKNQKLMSNFLKKPYDVFTMMEIPMIIHMPFQSHRETVHVAASHLDYTPTILNLLGIEKQEGFFMGRDVLNEDEGFVALQGLYNRGSFVLGHKGYLAARNYLFESGQFKDLKTQEVLPIEEARRGFEKALSDANNSDIVIKKDLVTKLLRGQTLPSEKVQSPHPDEIHIGFSQLAEAPYFYQQAFYWQGEVPMTDFQGKTMDLETFHQNVLMPSSPHIVVEVKEKVGCLLDQIAALPAEESHLYWPKIYRMNQYAYVHGLGFEKMVLDFRESNYTQEELDAFLRVVSCNTQFLAFISSEDEDAKKIYNEYHIPLYVEHQEDAKFACVDSQVLP